MDTNQKKDGEIGGRWSNTVTVSLHLYGMNCRKDQEYVFDKLKLKPNPLFYEGSHINIGMCYLNTVHQAECSHYFAVVDSPPCICEQEETDHFSLNCQLSLI